MNTIEDIIKIMEEKAPVSLAMSFDNVGLQIGSKNNKLTGILLALDLRDDTIDEAVKKNCNLIITHHPLILGGVKKIDFDTPTGRRIEGLIKNNITLYVSHTNFDICDFGTNDALFEKLNLVNKKYLNLENNLGRLGDLKEKIRLKDYIEIVKKSLNLKNVRVVGSEDKIISKVAICTGSGNEIELMDMAKSSGADLFITGDLTYHKMQYGEDIDLALIDGTHFNTEIIGLEYIYNILKEKIKNKSIFISAKSENIFKIY